jgi:hypothetical protein
LEKGDDFRYRLELSADDWATFFMVKGCLHSHALSYAAYFFNVSCVCAATEPSFDTVQLVMSLPFFNVVTSHKPYLFRLDFDGFRRHYEHFHS